MYHMIQMLYYLTNFKVLLHLVHEIHPSILLMESRLSDFLDERYPILTKNNTYWRFDPDKKTNLDYEIKSDFFSFQQPNFKILSNPIGKVIWPDYFWPTGPWLLWMNTARPLLVLMHSLVYQSYRSVLWSVVKLSF